MISCLKRSKSDSQTPFNFVESSEIPLRLKGEREREREREKKVEKKISFGLRKFVERIGNQKKKHTLQNWLHLLRD